MNGRSGRVVLGYDGSASAAGAVDWAAAEGARRGVPLTVLHVVDYLAVIPTFASVGRQPSAVRWTRRVASRSEQPLTAIHGRRPLGFDAGLVAMAACVR